MKDKSVFEMFRSPALINGERVMIGVEEAEAIKGDVVNEGFCFDPEQVTHMPWMELIVTSFREATTQPEFDHEFWGAWTFMPDWARRLESIFNGGWLNFPESPAAFTAEKLGDRVGFFLTASELKLESIDNNSELREQLEAAEWGKAVRGLDTEEAKKVSVEFPGFEDIQQMASESGNSLVMLRGTVFGIVGTQSVEECAKFFRGFLAGWQRARKIDVVSELSDYVLRMDIAELLSDAWDHVQKLKTRAEIAGYVLAHLPESKRAHFQAVEGRWESLCGGTLRDLFREVGLNPAKKGRPRKNGADLTK